MKDDQNGNRQITGLFLDRIGGEKIFGKQWEPSHDFGLRVASQPLSMYEFATKALKSIDLRFSYFK
jgi:hypothetical protein